jgi:hypothetical protein
MQGGKRAGAGRPKNAPNRASIERERRVAESGATPLEVMLKSMRLLIALADENKNDAKMLEHYTRAAASVAKDAAPYVHPRLSTVEVNGNVDRPIAHQVDLVGTVDLQSLSAEQLADLYRQTVRAPSTS